MAEDKEVIIFTMRTSHSEPVPKELGDTYIMTCDRCSEPVYTTSTTYMTLKEEDLHDYEIICNVCAAPLIEAELEKKKEDRAERMAGDPELQHILDEREDEFMRWMLARAKGEAGPLR